MYKNSFSSFVFAFSLGFSTHSSAAVNLAFGQPSFFGAGCSDSNTFVVQGDNMIEVSFTAYSLEVGGNSNERLGSSQCNIDIPLKVPRGYSAVIDRVEYYGIADLPTMSRMWFNADFQIDASRPTSLKHTIDGPYFDSFVTKKDFVGESKVSTNCREKSILRVISNLKVSTNSNFDLANVSIANLNANGVARYRYSMIPCF